MRCFYRYSLNNYTTKPFNLRRKTMDNKKFEKLIDLIINENEEQARDLFHDIVVEKSREIFESIMEEEMMDDEAYEGMGGSAGDLMDEITSEEEGMMEEEEDEFDLDADDADMDADMDFDEVEDDSHAAEEDEVEDAVVRIEDKLDRLMDEFESIMAGDDMDADMDADMGDDMDADVDADMDMKDEDEEVMESVQLQKVAAASMGDDGVQTKSPVTANSGQAGIASRPVKASTSTETGRTAPSSTNVKGAGSFKNAPGHKKQDLATAPKPVKSQASGVNTTSPVAK